MHKWFDGQFWVSPLNSPFHLLFWLYQGVLHYWLWWFLELQRGPIRHNGAKKELQLKHKNSLFTLQTFHYNYYWWSQSLLNRFGWEIYAFQR
jgi:hypothetical protein